MEENKVREDPEYKLDLLRKELEWYEKRRYQVVSIARIREILGEKPRKIKNII